MNGARGRRRNGGYNAGNRDYLLELDTQCLLQNFSLEAWARLYQLTGEEKYHTLTERYSDPGLFRKLLAGAHKKWGTKTRDFWCCHGTMVQTAGMKYYNDQAFFDENDHSQTSRWAVNFAVTVEEGKQPELAAVLEGPIVLAGLTQGDGGISGDQKHPEQILTGMNEHTYDIFPWQQSVYQTRHQKDNFRLVPLYDVTDEAYTVYLQIENQP